MSNGYHGGSCLFDYYFWMAMRYAIHGIKMNIGSNITNFFLILALVADSACGFVSITCKSTIPFPLFISRSSDAIEGGTNSNIVDTKLSPIDSSRRKLVVSHLIGLFTYRTIIQPSSAAAPSTNDGADSNKPKTLWMTGKEPRIPGQKPREKGDVSGTRKDPKFLRSLADCKSQCETNTGPDGLARPKDECLSDCQDICCTTYQQCTFGIVSRI